MQIKKETIAVVEEEENTRKKFKLGRMINNTS